MVTCASRRWRSVTLIKYVFVTSFLMMVMVLYHVAVLTPQGQLGDVRVNHVLPRRLVLDTGTYSIQKQQNPEPDLNQPLPQNQAPPVLGPGSQHEIFRNVTLEKAYQLKHRPLYLPVPESHTQHLKQNRSDANDALNAALLVTQKSVALHSGRESLTNKLSYFKSLMTSEERRILLDIAKRLDFITRERNMTYFLYGGALLGSYRHHDVIPWDDDLDVFVSLQHRYTLFRAISASSNYDVFLAGPRMKMWSKESRSMTKYPWGWPYVDISFYKENSTHIWDSSDEYKDYIYPKKIVFPLHKRPLAGFYFNAPRDSYANLKLTYKSSDCTTHHYSHKYEKIHRGKRKVTVPCDLMSTSIPFVHRSVHNNVVRETLMLGDSVIHSVVVEEPSYAITHPYKLQLMQHMT